MKKIYSKPEIDSVVLKGAWALCEGSPNAFNDPNDMFPAPKKRTPAF